MEHVPCEPTPDCKYAGSGCREDIHHTMYPRNQYKTKTEHQFRQLDENKIKTCRAFHDAIHASGYVPDKPTSLEMLREVKSPEASERSRGEAGVQIWLGTINLRREPGDVA